MSKNNIAFDSSARSIDKNGYMHVDSCHITKECISPYRGFEVVGYKELRLQPDKIYYAYRHAEELQKAIKTFNGLPLLLTHKFDSAETPQKEIRIGSVGTSAVWNAPYIDNVISVTDKEAIDLIEDGSYRELSASYQYTPDFTPGEFEGEKYDFVMREIKGAHVALVQKGRAGSDVSVADSAENITKNNIPKVNVAEPRFGGEHTASEGEGGKGESISPFQKKGRAGSDVAVADSAQNIIDNIKPKRSKRNMQKKTHLALAEITFAMDESPEIENIEGHLEEALLAVNKIEEAENKGSLSKDEDKNALIEKILSEHFKDVDKDTLKKIKDTLTDLAYGKVEGAGDEDEGKKEEQKKPAIDEDVKKAMDKAGCDSDNEQEQKAFAEGVKYSEGLVKKEEKPANKKESSAGAEDAAMVEGRVKSKMKDIYDAANRCKPLIGTIENPFAYDSADEVYGKALELSGINIKGYSKSAYKGMVDILLENKSNKPAFDSDVTSSSELDDRFKHLKNIGRG